MIYRQWPCLSLLSPLQLMIDITVPTLIGSDTPSLSDSFHVKTSGAVIDSLCTLTESRQKILQRACEICSSPVSTNLAVSTLHQVTFVQHSVRSLCVCVCGGGGGIDPFLRFAGLTRRIKLTNLYINKIHLFSDI